MDADDLPLTSAQRGSMHLLEKVRSELDRLTPEQAHAEQQAGALLIDVRMPDHRAATAEIPGALVIDLTVLPWRLDPTFEWRIPEATSFDQRIILMCRHGFATSLAAWNLRQLGLHRATDVIGGFDAWVEAGLPTFAGPADVRP